MKIFKRLVFLFTLAFSLSSCVDFKEVEITEIRSLKLVEITDKQVTLESEIRINNPNSFKIKVVKSDFDVYLKSVKMGKANMDTKITLLKNSNEYHKVTLVGNFDKEMVKSMSMLVASSLFGSKKVKFKVDGHVVGKAFFIKKKIHLVHEDEVPLGLFK